jgi:hypothetical protein
LDFYKNVGLIDLDFFIITTLIGLLFFKKYISHKKNLPLEKPIFAPQLAVK